MDELCLIVRSLIDSEVDDMILDLAHEIHSSIKGIPEERIQMHNHQDKKASIEKRTCVCPNCGQVNLIATRFSYHLAKCLGAGRQSSRRAKRRIVDQIMVITAPDKTQPEGNHCDRDFENNSISEDGSSCTDSTSSSITLTSSNRTQSMVINESQRYVEDFEQDEDDWKPRKRKQRATKPIGPKRIKKSGDVLLVVSPPNSKFNFPQSVVPFNKFCPVTNRLVIPLVPLPIGSVAPSDTDKIVFKTQQITPSSSETTDYFIESPLHLADDDQQTSVIVFNEDIQ